MRHFIIAIALVGLLAGCAHTLGQMETTATEAVKVPLAVYEDAKQNVSTVLKHFGHEDTKATK